MADQIARHFPKQVWHIFRSPSGWQAKRGYQSVQRQVVHSLSNILDVAMHQHENIGMIFDDDAAIAQFLADPEPQFSSLRTHISLLRRFESVLVLTLEELMAMIEAQFEGFQLDTMMTDRVRTGSLIS